MKIYRRVVINIFTGEIVEEDSYEYEGPVMKCKGGGGGGAAPDYAYNARMAAVAEDQQGIANKYMDFWESNYKDYEVAQIDANMQLMPHEIEDKIARMPLERERIAAQTGLYGAQAGLAGSQAGYYDEMAEFTDTKDEWLNTAMDYEKELMPHKKAVSTKFYEEALGGINMRGRMDTAAADASQSLEGAEGAARRAAGRMGLNTSSGRVADMLKTTSLDRAKVVGTARSSARIATEQEEFGRLSAANQQAGLPKLI